MGRLAQIRNSAAISIIVFVLASGVALGISAASLAGHPSPKSSHPIPIYVTGGQHLMNLLACEAGDGYCDESQMTAAEVKKVAAAKRWREAFACESGYSTASD